MAQVFTFAHQQNVQQTQIVANDALKLGDKIAHLVDFATSPAVAGATMTDAELQGFGNLFLAMTAAQVAAARTDLAAILTVLNGASSAGGGMTVKQILSTIIVGLPS